MRRNGTVFDIHERIYVGRQTLKVAVASQAVATQCSTRSTKNNQLRTLVSTKILIGAPIRDHYAISSRSFFCLAHFEHEESCCAWQLMLIHYGAGTLEHKLRSVGEW